LAGFLRRDLTVDQLAHIAVAQSDTQATAEMQQAKRKLFCSVAVSGDWTGEGIAKIGIYRSTTSQWALDVNNNLTWDAGTDKAGVFGAPGDLWVVGDWDATGVARAGVFRPSVGLWSLDKNGNLAWDAGVDLSGVFGAAGDTPVVGRW
jgi:hypothetical protein